MTFDTPIPTGNYNETCVWLGCTAAKGKFNEQDVFDAIWNKFQTLSVYTRDYRILNYWGEGIDTGDYCTTSTLLKNGDGRCSAWDNFFEDILKSQGINSSKYHFAINPYTVKSYLDTMYNLNCSWFIILQQKGNDFQGEVHAPNEGNFLDHIINLYNNKLYDVTCGVGGYLYNQEIPIRTYRKVRRIYRNGFSG